GRIIQKAPLLFALFEHGTSRAEDPQLHTHALAINITVLGDEKARAIDSTYFYNHKMAAGSLYRCELAQALRELGFEIRQVQHGSSLMFEIVGIPEEAMEFYSKRRAEIEEKLNIEFGSLDSATAIGAAIATLETRRNKEDEKPRQERIRVWGEEMSEKFGLEPRHIEALLNPERTISPAEKKQLREAIFEK